MILYNRLRTAIIAVHKCLCVLELSRHGLALNSAIKISKCVFHVSDRLAAYWAAIRAFRILRKTFVVNAMPTAHHHHSFGRREHVVPTDRAIALGGALNTAMSSFNRYWQAHAAGLAFI